MTAIRTYNGTIPHNAERRVARLYRAERRDWILSGVGSGLMVGGMWIALWLIVAHDLGVV
jgi:hypothetical protein